MIKNIKQESYNPTILTSGRSVYLDFMATLNKEDPFVVSGLLGRSTIYPEPELIDFNFGAFDFNGCEVKLTDNESKECAALCREWAENVQVDW